VRGRFHTLGLAEAPLHPDLLHSPSKSIRAFTPVFAGFGVNALMAPGEKETAVRPGKRQSHTPVWRVSAPMAIDPPGG